MRLYSILTFSLLFSFQFSLANHDSGKSEPTKPQTGLLWEITGKGLEKPSYLFGTIHMICPDDFIWDATIEKAFAATEQLVMELDMDEPTLMQEMQKHSINPGMKNISSEFSKEQLATLDAFLKDKYGAGMQQLGIMKPFVLSSMIIPKYFSCATPQAYETSFVSLAKKAEVEVVGLETVAFQMSIFDNMSFEDQIGMVTQAISDSVEMKEQLANMVTAYRSQDLEQLYQVMIESQEYEGYVDALLTNRNEAWIPKIVEIITAKPSFIAVGAGHLGAEKGVIELLRHEGYNVKPVSF